MMTTSTLYFLTVLAAIGGFLFGYDTGVISGAMLFIRDEFHLSSFMQEILISITIGSAAVFSLVGGVMNNHFGRKITIIVASFVFISGSVTMAVASHVWALLIGRTLVGVAIGLSSMTIPMYVTECSPAHIRGTLVTVNILFITGGQFVASLVDGAFSYDKVNGWRYMLGIAAVPAMVQLIGFLFMPESPRWLLQNQRVEEARSVLTRLRGECATEESDIMESSAAAERDNEGFILFRMVRSRPVMRALIIGSCLQMFQQLAGINTVMYYSATIIKMSGVESNSQAIWLSAVTSCTNFLFTIVGLVLVDRIGRRKLVLASLIGIFLSLLALGAGFFMISYESPRIDIPNTDSPCGYLSTCAACIDHRHCGFCYKTPNNTVQNASCLFYNDTLKTRCPSHNLTTAPAYDWTVDHCPTSYAWLVVLGMVTYLAFFAPGMGPMPWTINSEIFPTWARSTANSITTMTNWSVNLVVSLTFLTLTESITKAGAFWLYASIVAVALVFFTFVLPETKGRQLETIDELFIGSWFVISPCSVKHKNAKYEILSEYKADINHSDTE